jgi:hypothetical protein
MALDHYPMGKDFANTLKMGNYVSSCATHTIDYVHVFQKGEQTT